jgi:hypothetical protein
VLGIIPKDRARSKRTVAMQMQPMAHDATAPSQMLPRMPCARPDGTGAVERKVQQATKASRPKKPLTRGSALPAALAQTTRKKSLRKQREAQKRWTDSGDVGFAGYLLAIATGEVRDVIPPEICDAMRNAATTAGTLINLRNWSTESIVYAPYSKSQQGRLIRALRVLPTVGQDLIGVSRPGNGEQCEKWNYCQGLHFLDCGVRLWPKMSAPGAFSRRDPKTIMLGGTICASSGNHAILFDWIAAAVSGSFTANVLQASPAFEFFLIIKTACCRCASPLPFASVRIVAAPADLP